MTRRHSDRILTDGDLDGQPQIGGGGGRTPAARCRGLSRGRVQSGRGRAASGDRGSLREGRMGPIVSGTQSSDRGLDTISPSSSTRPTSTTHIPTISPTGPSSSNHTPSSHSNQSGSSSRHGTPSPTIFAPPSTASPAPSSWSHKAMGAPLERLKGAMKLPRSLLSSPLPSTPSAAPQEGRGGTLHIVRFSITIESVGHGIDTVTIGQEHISGQGLIRLHITEKMKRAALVQALQSTTVAYGLFRTYEDILALDKDEYDEAKLVRRREEHTQATPDQPIDEEQLYYDAAEVCPKGRVYGL
ncbi:hypothetical protein Scep_024865 [Stephania cephalantha]|uniref:Uncharacterized protein n=1 Tax=Stephania cephalantha TaxID=152367 RepID=A0AAP0F046_9MAGN